MKKGYHSKQTKTFGILPRSEFLGVALGYAAGLIIQGITKNPSHILILAGIAVGLSAGYLIDRFFFSEPDEIQEEAQCNLTDSKEDSGIGADKEQV